MNTILLILTGGTIGSEKKRNIVNISKNNYLKSFLLTIVITLLLIFFSCFLAAAHLFTMNFKKYKIQLF